MAIISLLLGGLLFGLAGLILALPFTAVLKVILEANPGSQPYGFLIGEPKEYHLKRYSNKIVFKRWKLKEIRKKKAQKLWSRTEEHTSELQSLIHNSYDII